MQRIVTVTLQHLTDMRQFVEVIFHTFQTYHRLTLSIDGKCLVLHHLRRHIDLRQLADACQQRVVGSYHLTHHRCDLDLRVHLREEGCYHVVKSVKHTQGHHQCHRCHGNPYGGDTANHIDSVGALLREQVTAGDVEREVQISN